MKKSVNNWNHLPIACSGFLRNEIYMTFRFIPWKTLNTGKKVKSAIKWLDVAESLHEIACEFEMYPMKASGLFSVNTIIIIVV